MKNQPVLFLFVLSVFFIAIFNTAISGQANPDWNHSFDAKINWSTFNAKTSIYYLYGEKTLTAFDCIDKKVLWKMESAGLKLKQINWSDEYPIAWLGGMKSEKKGLRKVRNVLINPISGKILFDSDRFEMDKMNVQYVLFDQELVFVVGKHKKKRVMALAEFGAKGWSWIIDVPVKLNRISIDAKMKKYPMANKDHLFIHYARDVFTIDRKNGAIKWQKNAKEIKLSNAFVRKDFLRTNDPNFYLITSTEKGFDVMAHDYATGEPQWEKPLLTHRSYSITGREKDFFIRDSKFFDFVSYDDGKRQRLNFPEFEGNLGKIYLQKGAYLVTTKPAKRNKPLISVPETKETLPHLDLHWLNSDYEKIWPAGVKVNGKSISKVKQTGDRLLVLSDMEIVLVEISTGKTLRRKLVTESPLVSFNPEGGAVVFFDTLTSHLQHIDLQSGAIKTINEKVQFKHKKKQLDKPVGLKAVGDKFALIGTRNLWLIDKEGNIAYQKYFESPNTFNWKKALLVVGGMVAGVIFNDELRQINYELYKEGLIEPDEFWNNAWAMGVYNKAGTAAVGGDYIGRLMPEKERNIASEFFNDTWLVTDKLDKGKFGLRVFDIPSGKEKKTIWLAKKEAFSYEIDFRQLGVYIVNGKDLLFYKL